MTNKTNLKEKYENRKFKPKYINDHINYKWTKYKIRKNIEQSRPEQMIPRFYVCLYLILEFASLL